MFASILAVAAGEAAGQRLSRCAGALEITWLVHVIGAFMLALHAACALPDAWHAAASLSGWQWSLMLYSSQRYVAVSNFLTVHRRSAVFEAGFFHQIKSLI